MGDTGGQTEQPGIVLSNIQALRAFAALSVVLFHVLRLTQEGQPVDSVLGNFRYWGKAGVDVFFVISGFIMVHTHRMNPKSAGRFLYLRLLRIWPIYAVFTIVTVLAIYGAEALVTSGNLRAWTVLSVSFLTQAVGYREPVMYVGWTLEFEMLFYVVFALSLLAVRGLALVAPVLVALVFAFGFPPILVEFLFGLLAGWAFRFPVPRWVGWGAVLTGHSLLVASYGLGETMDMQVAERTGWFRVWVWGVPAAILVYGAALIPQTRSRLLLLLGASSYSLYLGHVIGIELFRDHVMERFAIEFPLEADLLLYTGLSLLVGLLCYRFVEAPLLRLGRGIGRRFDPVASS